MQEEAQIMWVSELLHLTTTMMTILMRRVNFPTTLPTMTSEVSSRTSTIEKVVFRVISLDQVLDLNSIIHHLS